MPRVGIETEHVAGVRLLGREGADRPPLGVVRVEQLGPCPPVENVRELPREVVPVLNTAVAAEPTGRRHLVHRVPGEEDAALLEPLGIRGRRRPALHVLDLDRDVRVAERLADVLDARRPAHVLADPDRACSVGVRRRVHDEEAGLQIDREAEEPLQARSEDVDHAQVAVTHQPAHVRLEVDRDAVREAAVAEPADTEPLADRAVRAVGRDEIPRPHGALGPSVTRPDDGRHPLRVLLDRDGLRRVLDPRSQTLRGSEQHRLEPDLRDEDPRRRTDLLHPFVDEAEVPVELLATEALDRHDRAVLDELPRSGLLDLLLQADGAIRLDRALVDERCPRVDRSAAMALEDERGHAVMAEKHRRGKTDEAAAHDQHGNVFVHHRPLYGLQNVRGFAVSISSICEEVTPAPSRAGTIFFEMWR